MEDAYGIGITNRYEFLLDSSSTDPQAILKQKAKKDKKAAKKLAGKENSDNGGNEVGILDKVNDGKKVKSVAKGAVVGQSQSQQEPAPKLRSMKDMQNIQGNGDGNTDNGFKEFRGNASRRNYGNNKDSENRENGEQPNRGYRANRNFDNRNNENGNGKYVNRSNENRENGEQSNRGNRMNNGYRHFENRNGENGNNENRHSDNRNNENRPYDNRNNENGTNENFNNAGQDIEYSQRERDNERPPRRQGNDRNFGNRRSDGQRRNFEGRGGKRDFDRQSGSDKTGVKAIDKRDGGGAHNWGTHKQDIEDLNKAGSEQDFKDDGNSVENAKSEENVEVKPVIMTLDEYKSLQGERAKPVFNTRKAGEGEDKKKWKNLVPLKKKEDVKSSEEEMEIDMSMFPQRKRSIKTINDITVRFNERKTFGNKGGKDPKQRNGDGRGGRNRKDDANRQNAPKLDDRNFPSLG